MFINFPPLKDPADYLIELSTAAGLNLSAALHTRLLRGRFPVVPRPNPFSADADTLNDELYERTYPAFFYEQITLLCEQGKDDAYLGSGSYEMLPKGALVSLEVGLTMHPEKVGRFVYVVQQRRPILGFEHDKSLFQLVLKRMGMGGQPEAASELADLMENPLRVDLSVAQRVSGSDYDLDVAKMRDVKPEFIGANSVLFTLRLPDVDGLPVLVSDPRYFRHIAPTPYGLELVLVFPASEEPRHVQARQGLLNLHEGSRISGGQLIIAGVPYLAAAEYGVNRVVPANLGSSHQPLELHLNLAYMPTVVADNSPREGGIPDSLVDGGAQG